MPAQQEIFLIWLRILCRVPRSILWLLRFPGAGEEHLLRSARLWAGEDVASQIHFTDVAKKDWHVSDVFYDLVRQMRDRYPNQAKTSSKKHHFKTCVIM